MADASDAAGISRWRQVSETLVREMDQGLLAPGDKLPAEVQLAERFGVARQTVRRALSHLRSEGRIAVEVGRGTFVADRVFEYQIAAQKTFEQNLVESAMAPSRELLEMSRMPAGAGLAEKLAVDPGEDVLFVLTLGMADGRPVVLGRVYLPLSRYPALEAEFARRTGDGRNFALAEILAAVGVPAYSRRFIRLRSRLPTAEETELLGLSALDSVVETLSVSDGPDDRPVFYSVMAYAGSRVEFHVGREAFARE